MENEIKYNDIIEKVRVKYPKSICVKTSMDMSWIEDKVHINSSHYRIWPTNGFFETRYIGIGNTREEAWKNALKNINSGRKK